MVTTPLSVRRPVVSPPAKESLQGMTDAQLLERFASHHDAVAFEELVRRHGGMVLRVCQRVLQHKQDAEDAFQATFIVLARKAGTVTRAGQFSAWLYGVAYRVALNARAKAKRRQDHERLLDRSDAETAKSPSGPEPSWRDLRPVLDEELNRLPEKYRSPIVLCYLEGKTVDETATQLGCPKGTVHTWLVRGRERLQNRLVRRGLGFSAVALTALLAHNAASGAVPAALATSTSQAAWAGVATATAAATLTAPAVTLANATLKAMLWARIKTAMAAITAFTVLTAVPAYLILKPAPNLVGHYAYAESNGTLVHDASDRGNHGTLVGGVTWSTGPKPGTSSLSFDGKSGQIKLPQDLNQWLGGNATVAFWINTNQFGDVEVWRSPALLGANVRGPGKDIMWGFMDNMGRIGLDDDQVVVTTRPINDNQWHHIAMTRDADKGVIAVYLDGLFNAKTSSKAGSKTTPFSSIGRIENVSLGRELFFQGRISDLRFYRAVLAADDIRTMAD